MSEQCMETMPFGDVDVAEEYRKLIRTGRFVRRFLPFNPSILADTIRGLWIAGNQRTQELITVEGVLEIQAGDLKGTKKALGAAQSAARNMKIEMEDPNNYVLRIEHALKNMRAIPVRHEKPYAVVFSPGQWERLSWQSQVFKTGPDDEAEGRRFHTYNDLKVFTARGFYGPAVMTRDAFTALSRQTPEMDVRRV